MRTASSPDPDTEMSDTQKALLADIFGSIDEMENNREEEQLKLQVAETVLEQMEQLTNGQAQEVTFVLPGLDLRFKIALDKSKQLQQRPESVKASKITESILSPRTATSSVVTETSVETTKRPLTSQLAIILFLMIAGFQVGCGLQEVVRG